MGLSFSEKSANFYLENYFPLADEVFRFIFAIVLNMEIAKKLVKQLFDDVIKDRDKLLVENQNPRFLLLKKSIEMCQKAKKYEVKIGQSKIGKILKELTVDERVAVVTVDFVGLPSEEASGLMSCQELEVRKLLAQGREKLLAHAKEI